MLIIDNQLINKREKLKLGVIYHSIYFVVQKIWYNIECIELN